MALLRHRSPAWLGTLVLCGVGLQFSSIANARADEDTAAETAGARALAVDGLKLAWAGKCDQAIPKLDRAEKTHHSAIVLGRLGECEVSEGRLVEGTEMLRRVLREPLPANPSAALSNAYERAQIALDAAKPKIAGLTISISAPAGTELHLTVDGQQVANTLLDSELPADPGEHVVEASAPGFLKASARVSVALADKQTVTLKLEVDPNAPPPSAPSSTDDTGQKAVAMPAASLVTPHSPPLARPDAVAAAPNHVAAYASWGVGLVGVGVGTAFGVVAIKDKQDLNAGCAADVCPASSRNSVDTAKRSGNISTIAFAVGGAGLVLGTVLYFTIDGVSGTHAASGAGRGYAGLQHGRALVGPGSVQLAADF